MQGLDHFTEKVLEENRYGSRAVKTNRPKGLLTSCGRKCYEGPGRACGHKISWPLSAFWPVSDTGSISDPCLEQAGNLAHKEYEVKRFSHHAAFSEVVSLFIC